MKYLKIFFASLKYCFVRSLEFRAETISWSFNSVSWAILSVLIINLIFGQVYSIAGWTKQEALVLSMTGSMFNSFMWLFIIPSWLYFSELIRKGDFDFYLLKPVSPQFLVSVSRFEFDNYLRLFVMLGLILKYSPSLSGIVGYFILLFCGLICFYGLFTIISTLCFWTINNHGLDNLFDSMVTMGRYPSNIFEGGMRVVFFFLIPMAFVATFPVQVLLGKSGWELILLGIIMAIIFLTVSHLFWNFALKRYSSASS